MRESDWFPRRTTVTATTKAAAQTTAIISETMIVLCFLTISGTSLNDRQ
jgi:hypothetical protein